MSFWTFNGGDIDGNEIDWTGLSEVSIPQPASSLTTPWTKALDFSGSSERAQQVSTSSSHCPLMMGNVGATVGGNATAGYTANSSNSRPWATAVVFRSDGNASNQHLWNVGEGAGSTDDNIYVRQTANGDMYFGWGRSGALNECHIGDGFDWTQTAQDWFGLYIAHTGERLSGSNATGPNLANCFDIRFMRQVGTNWEIVTGGFGDSVGNRSTTNNWNAGTTGGRMDRTFGGAVTIGGRGSNRSFHGQVASMVMTTLKLGDTMPVDAEILMMTRDPQQWLTDYKIGNQYRLPQGTSNFGPFVLNASGPAYGTQVWLMGDGASDAYAQIRNDVYPSIQNVYPLNMVSMVSNDIITVNIPGLT